MIKNLEWIRDVIYDYIYFTRSDDTKVKAEKDIIDSLWVQRLRRIFQLQSSWLIFPNAVHTRFLHSLGAMHLAGEFASKLYPHFKESFPDEYIPEEKEYVVEVFRLAGLLHDIGHSPFGHLIDDIYTYKFFKKTHEDISSKIIIEELGDIIRKIRSSPYGSFEKEIEPELIAKFVKLPQDMSGYKLWERVFAKIMFGPYNVDAIDFLLRDKYFTGVKEIGDINYKRLFEQSLITRRGLTLNKSALAAFRAFLITRYNLFKNVYFNEKKDLIEKYFAKLIPIIFDIMKLGNIYENLNKFLYLDDFSLASAIRNWSQEKNKKKNEIAEKWLSVIDKREIPYKKIFEDESYIYKFMPRNSIITEEEIMSKMKNIITDSDVIVSQNIVDIRNKNLFGNYTDKESLEVYDDIKSVAIYDEENDKFLNKEDDALLYDIPLKYMVIRIFVEKNCLIDSLNEDNIKDAQLEFGLKQEYVSDKDARTEITNV